MIYQPQLIVAAFDFAAPGANTGIINAVNSSAHAPRFNSYMDVYAALTVASTINVTCTDGTDTHKWGLNESLSLQSKDLYRFKVMTPARDQAGSQLTFDIEIESDGVVEALFIYSVRHGMP